MCDIEINAFVKPVYILSRYKNPKRLFIIFVCLSEVVSETEKQMLCWGAYTSLLSFLPRKYEVTEYKLKRN